MDALSDVLRIVNLTGGVFLDAEFSAPWCIKSQLGPDDCKPFLPDPEHMICFHYVVEGLLRAKMEGESEIELRAGEAIMFPRNDAHFLGSEIRTQATNAHDLIASPQGGGLLRILHGGGGAKTRLVCGFLASRDALRNPLLATLPAVLTVDVRGTPGGEWMERSFSYAAREIAGGDPGAATILAKVSELLFVEAVRRYVTSLPEGETGWLSGLRDPAVGQALSLIHARLSEPWTAESLAHTVGLSRSVFAERFTGLIGEPPIRYLTNWRLQVAAQKLREGRRSVSQIAFDVGYESEAAFTRAFKREHGVPPATWKRQALKSSPAVA